MAARIPQLLSPPDGTLLLRELNHRVNNELTCAICAISVKAMQSDNTAAKTALLDVVEILQQCADVNRALRMPEQANLNDAARYLQQLCVSIVRYRMDHLTMRVVFSADDLRLEGEACWGVGVVVPAVLSDWSRHGQVP